MRPRQSRRRQGIAAVELAICLPVLTLVVFGTMQLTASSRLRHMAVMIADEVARLGNDPDRTLSELRSEGRRLASEANLIGVEVRTRVVQARNGPLTDDVLHVAVSIPVDQNYSGPSMMGLAGRVEVDLTTYRPKP